MPIQDNELGWLSKRLYIPIREFSGFDNNGTADISLSQGTPTLEPITTSEIAGLPMTTADEIGHILAIPWDLDRSQEVYGRIIFQHAAAGADTPQFKQTVKFFAKQEAMVEFIANADQSVTYAAHTCSTNNPSLEVTVWTDLNWLSSITATDVVAAISIELDALGSASADEIKVLGIELLYGIKAMDTYKHKTRTEDFTTSAV